MNQTAANSAAAAALTAKKKLESWFLWICVNSICIRLYYARDVKFVAILYIFSLALAINDLVTWNRELRKNK